MLTDPKLRSQVDALWDKFWTGELADLTGFITTNANRTFMNDVILNQSRLCGNLSGLWVNVAARAVVEPSRDIEGLFESLLAEAFA